MKRTNRIRLTESQLHRVIKESVREVLKEYGGYDSEKIAYGEQSRGNEYMRHLNRFGLANGYTRTDVERQKGDERAKRNGENLDKLRLRQHNNPYRNHLDTVNRANKMKSDSLDKLKNSLHESRFSKFKHANNPLFSKEEAEYWDNLEFPNDEEYYKMIEMLKAIGRDSLYKKLGHDKYMSFEMRLEEDDPALYKEYCNNGDGLAF